MIFVDANVPMYLVGGEHPHKVDAQRVLERLTGEQRHLVTSSEVLQEIMHRYVSADRRDWIEHAFNAMRAVVDEVFAVEQADVLAAKDLVLAYQRLSARDAVHAAVMRRRQITEILSFDSGFDEVAGIRRLPAPLPAP
ncbi:MAG: type II toxin-antitoxin system VapC family toxin [Solirubrobacteraceae bacterium]